jgi:hypothetical protein
MTAMARGGHNVPPTSLGTMGTMGIVVQVGYVSRPLSRE